MEHANADTSTKTILRKRPQVNCDRPIRTDQSQQPMTDINQIMENYVKTGMLPNYSSTPLLYIDDVNKPTFEEVHSSIQQARQLFDRLPTQLKSELGNDYRKLESWIANPDNLLRAEKYGLVSIHKPQSPPPKVEPEAQKTEQAKA